ncbi:hypothetical protein EDB80DRAFT_731751 [Ilyonectria destructans]|nr:hypothetical protein EDB80DRAFT_731751 [Ilyonectria destructans]
MSVCTNNSLPDASSIGVPKDINAGFVPYTSNYTLDAMHTCCEPNEVHKGGKNDCTLWCELPDSLMERAQGSNSLGDVFTDCLTQANTNASFIISGIQEGLAAHSLARLPSVAQVGIVALGVLLAVQMV